MTRGVVGDLLIGGAQVAAATLTAPLGRTRYNHWGATDREVAASMPGDDLVPAPRLGYTRAVSIDAPPEQVWPWLVQIGQGRGGLYSFDGLENLARCDIHSVDRIVEQHQHVAPGDLIRMGPEGYPCFRVDEVQVGQTLVLVGADPQPPHETARSDSPGGLATWQWLLREGPAGTTRLLVRQRLTYPRSMSVLWHVVEPIAFVMERQMLLGIKERAERTAAVADRRRQ